MICVFILVLIINEFTVSLSLAQAELRRKNKVGGVVRPVGGATRPLTGELGKVGGVVDGVSGEKGVISQLGSGVDQQIDREDGGLYKK